MQLRYGLLAELVAAPGEGDALAAFLASAHIGATVGGNATGFSPLSPVAVPLWADPRVGSLTPLAVRLLFRPYSWAIKRESISRGPFLPYSGRPRRRRPGRPGWSQEGSPR